MPLTEETLKLKLIKQFKSCSPAAMYMLSYFVKNNFVPNAYRLRTKAFYIPEYDLGFIAKTVIMANRNKPKVEVVFMDGEPEGDFECLNDHFMVPLFSEHVGYEKDEIVFSLFASRIEFVFGEFVYTKPKLLRYFRYNMKTGKATSSSCDVVSAPNLYKLPKDLKFQKDLIEWESVMDLAQVPNCIRLARYVFDDAEQEELVNHLVRYENNNSRLNAVFEAFNCADNKSVIGSPVVRILTKLLHKPTT